MIRITKRLKVCVVIRSAVFEWDDVIDMHSLAVEDSTTLAACERIAYEYTSAARSPLRARVVRNLLGLTSARPKRFPTWYVIRHLERGKRRR